jgi:hypothetical protein
LAYLLYKDFLIIAGADVEKSTGWWVPIASVSWAKADGKRGLHFFTRTTETYPTADDAVSFALTTAKTGVDQRLDSPSQINLDLPARSPPRRLIS